jgi:hypothetical protein
MEKQPQLETHAGVENHVEPTAKQEWLTQYQHRNPMELAQTQHQDHQQSHHEYPP